MSYSTLKARVASWTHRGDYETFFDGALELAEAKMSRRIQHPYNEVTDTVSIVDGVGSLPSDYGSIERVAFGNRTLMVESYSNSKIPQGGTPNRYSINGTDIVLNSIPTDGDATITYYQRIQALTSVDTANWLETFAPDLYFYGVMAEMGDALNNDSMMTKYAGKFGAAIDELNKDGRRMKFGNAPLQVTTV